MEKDNTQIYFLLALIAVGAGLVFFIFLPYFDALLLAMTLGVIFYPMYRRVLGYFKNRRGLAAFATVLGVIILILIPLSFFGYQLFQESQSLYNELRGAESEGAESFLSSVESRLEAVVPGTQINVQDYVRRSMQFLVDNLNVIFSGIAEFLVTLFLGLFAFFYFLKDGKKLKERLISWSPLSDDQDEQIIRKLRTTVNSVIRGALAVALIQGVLTSIGFILFGVPNPTLWGGFAFISALIPTLGTAVVIIPGVIYLFLTGSTVNAVLLLTWGAVAVGLVDNVLEPKFMHRGGIELHPFFILLSVLGGLNMFGLVGFILGPMALSFFATVVDVYAKEFKPKLGV